MVFFKTAQLKKATYCYEQALNYIQQGEPEKSYILHKQAWVYINQKKGGPAYGLLSQAVKEKAKNLKNLILFDMGKIWVESQYFKNKAPLSTLVTDVQTLSPQEKKNLIKGMEQGLRRMEKQSLAPLVSALSKNKALSTTILNELLSSSLLPVRFSCRLLPWIESAEAMNLNKKPVFSVLNSCTHYWISKKKNPNRSKQLKRITHLYTQFERKGMERWPLALSYHHLRWHNKACEESLYQLTESVASISKNSHLDTSSPSEQVPPATQGTSQPTHHSQKKSSPMPRYSQHRTTSKEKKHGTFSPALQAQEHIDIATSLKESHRFCKKAQVDKTLALNTATALLSSPSLSTQYKNKEGDYESALSHLFKIKVFSPILKIAILNAHPQWRGKDFLPSLLLSNINDYQKEDLKVFMDRFSVKPLNPYYLNILIAREDILTEANMNKWLPLTDVDSYSQSKPYIKAFLAGHLSEQTKKNLAKNLLSHFPSKEKEKKEISLFLSLYYLKSHQTLDLFQNWKKLSSVFSQKNLAVELFEKSLLDKGQTCKNLHAVLNPSTKQDSDLHPSTAKPTSIAKLASTAKLASKTKPSPMTKPTSMTTHHLTNTELLTFIHQCCEVIHPFHHNIRLQSEKGVTKTLSNIEASFAIEASSAIKAGSVHRMKKAPSVLRSSALARDFMVLASVQKTTLQLEKNISHLEKNTSKMVMNLRKSISRYQKRKWHLKNVAEQVRLLLTKQINLFEKELNRLAKSSPYGKKYKELKKMVHQWR